MIMLNRKLSAEDLQDMGMYLRGLLQIMAADSRLHEREKEKIREFAERAGFEKEYIEKTMNGLLENRYFPEMPAKFNSRDTAEDFLMEAAEIAVCDGNFHPHEKKWLLEACAVNEIEPEMIESILNRHEKKNL